MMRTLSTVSGQSVVRTAFLLSMFCLAGSAMAQSSYSLRSPDQKIEVRVRGGDRVKYDVLLNGKLLLQDSTLSIKIDQVMLGLQPKIKTTKPRAVNQEIVSPVAQKSSRIRENYNELKLEMEGNYAVVFRAYNEGIAYRLETSLPEREVKVYGEEVSLNFAGDYNVYYPKEESFFSHNEREFLYLPLRDVAPTSLASLPAVVVSSDGVKLAVGESDIEDYPGLWLRGNNSNSLSATFPPYPLKEELRKDRSSDRDFRVTQTADYIAVTKGTRTYPWRIVGIARTTLQAKMRRIPGFDERP